MTVIGGADAIAAQLLDHLRLADVGALPGVPRIDGIEGVGRQK